MHNEPLFSADFGLAEWLAVLFRKWGRKCSYSEWRTLSQHDNEVVVASIGRYGYGRRGSSRTGRQPVTLRAKQLSCCEKNFPAVSFSCNSDQNWPPRSCDLTPCDFFLWGFVKSRVHANKPQQFPISRRRFEVSLAKFSRNYVEMSSRVSSKGQECASSHGGHLPDIVFHNQSQCVYFIFK
jgi:hypothetical protein